jgi:hypothetical protein
MSCTRDVQTGETPHRPTPEARARRAAAVRALLEDANVREAFAAIEADLVAEWKRTHSADERENLWRAVDLIERLRTWLRTAASHDLAALRRAK